MIVCLACSYPNDEAEHRCERCGRRFDASGFLPDNPDACYEGEEEVWSEEAPADWGDAPAEPWRLEPPSAPARRNAEKPPWEPIHLVGGPGGNNVREEVSARLEKFRARRRAQEASMNLSLDFDAPPAATKTSPLLADPPSFANDSAAVARPPTPRPSHYRPFDRSRKVIPFKPARHLAGYPPGDRRPEEELRGASVVRAPEGSGLMPPGVPSAPAPAPRERPQMSFGFAGRAPAEAVEIPVAPLAVRVMAAMADAAILACAYGLFFLAYTLVGGKFVFERAALLSMAAALVVVAFGYFALFLQLSDATPGMRWVGLRLVTFEGEAPRRSRRALRLVGLVASAVAAGVGFLWAAADEDGLTWHDRISRTCLTLN